MLQHLLTRWLPVIEKMADTDNNMRFAALIGSYARKETPADPWSDLDLVTAFDDPDRMFADTSWLSAFGDPKIVFSQGLPAFGGRECRAIFADGSMLDMVIFATEDLAVALFDKQMQYIFLRGYKILCDKNCITDSPRFAPDRPLPEESREDMVHRFQNTARSFWFHVIWTKKKLCRGEIMQAKVCADRFMKDLLFDILRMKAKLSGGPSSDTWHEARFFERCVDAEDLDSLRLAYARYDAQDIAEVLERTEGVFAKVARETADLLDTEYPDEAENFAREMNASLSLPADSQTAKVTKYIQMFREATPDLQVEPAPLEPIIRSMYLCVRDMERAIRFYGRFLDQEPVERDDIYSVFDVGGFRLGLFAFEKIGEAHTFGDNCLPSIEVDSEEKLREKLRDVQVVYGPKPIGSFLVAEFLDSEGNRVEITTRKETAG